MRTSQSNDEYALDLQPVVEGDPTGVTVTAAATGVVRHVDNPSAEELATAQAAGWPSFTGLGRRVIMAHCDPTTNLPCPGVDDHNVLYYSLYSHLESVSVQPGATVPQGYALGQLGATGNTGGTPHLHLALYQRAADCEGCVDATLAGSNTVSVVGGQAVVPEPMGDDSCLRRGRTYAFDPCEFGANAAITGLHIPAGCCDSAEIWPNCDATDPEHHDQWGHCGQNPDFSSATAVVSCSGLEPIPLQVSASGSFCAPPAPSNNCHIGLSYTLQTESGPSTFHGETAWSDVSASWTQPYIQLQHEQIDWCCF